MSLVASHNLRCPKCGSELCVLDIDARQQRCVWCCSAPGCDWQVSEPTGDLGAVMSRREARAEKRATYKRNYMRTYMRRRRSQAGRGASETALAGQVQPNPDGSQANPVR